MMNFFVNILILYLMPYLKIPFPGPGVRPDHFSGSRSVLANSLLGSTIASL